MKEREVSKTARTVGEGTRDRQSQRASAMFLSTAQKQHKRELGEVRKATCTTLHLKVRQSIEEKKTQDEGEGRSWLWCG